MPEMLHMAQPDPPTKVKIGHENPQILLKYC